MIKNLILSCLVTFALISIVGCADDERHSSSESSAATMTVDSKDMHHRSDKH